MALKKDKQKVLGETFDDERVRGFLASEDSEYADYLRIERAYRGMKADNFHTFVGFFIEAGLNINEKNRDGHTILAVVKQHRHAEAYIKTLEAFGAQI